MKNTVFTLGVAVFWAFAATCPAHPLPDVAVRAHFEQNGDWTLQVEIDPRSFQPDPNVAPYLTNADLGVTPAEQQEKLKTQAREYAQKVVEVVLDPAVEVKPELTWEFTAAENAPLKLPEDPVMLTGTWRTKLPAGSKGYSIKALPAGTLSVLYHNTALGKKVERYQILFPGETSYVLDLQTFTPRTKAPLPITEESVKDPGAASGSLEGMCEMCGTCSTGGYMLPTLIAVAGLVMVVAWLRRKPKA
ncbi:hypothetical protein [Prosthecobacter fluviatilis]|uniref:Uncharacterized protein n=1 Tax=Prosthecobacter fluviatilis TaxID=445931 RepID=A0ABW0KMA0_9BACT